MGKIKKALEKPRGYVRQNTYNDKIKRVSGPFIKGVTAAVIIWFYLSVTAAAYAYDTGTGLFVSLKYCLSVAAGDPLYGFRGGIAFGGFKVLFAIGILIIAVFSLWLWAFEVGRVHHDINTLKGSSEWADPADLSAAYGEGIKVPKSRIPLIGKLAGYETDYLTPYSNSILSQNFQMSLDTRINPKAVNTLILGTTGSGKSRYYLKPNLLQMNASYVITDPSGGILQQCGETLRRFGYNIRIFDINNMGDCSTYNPMKYCYGEADVKKLVNAFIKNTAAPGSENSNKDPFWDDAMNAFLCSITSLIVNYGMDAEIMGGKTYIPCFASLAELTRMANKSSENPSGQAMSARIPGRRPGGTDNNTAGKSELNIIFENVRKRECLNADGTENGRDKPYCLREWENFKIAPEKTSTTILMTAAVRLDPFNIDKVRDLTTGPVDEYGKPMDTIELDTFGDRRDALFIIIPTNDRTYNFLAAFLYTQLFDILYRKGEHSAGTNSVKLPNNELVKWFDADSVATGADTQFLADIKDTVVEKVEVNGILHGYSRKKKEKVTLDDSYYEIRTKRDNQLVGRRPTLQLAADYQQLLKKARIVKGNGQELPCHVRVLFDEFPNTGEIPEFKEKLATIRKYGISVCVICQTITQLKGMYPDDYEVIDANCPETIFLGGDENTNNEYISKKLGKTTVIGANGSINERSSSSHSYNIEERDLMKPEELGRIPYEKCIVAVYGEQPVYDNKFDYPAHKHYRFTQDYGSDLGLGDSYMVFDRTPYSDQIGHINPIDTNPRRKAKELQGIGPAIHSMRLTGDLLRKVFGREDDSPEDILDGISNESQRMFGFDISSSPIT